MKERVILIAFFTLLLAAQGAQSSGPAAAEPNYEALYAPLGVTGFYRTDGTAHFGAEASSAYFYGTDNPWWFGAYADMTTDLNEFRFTAGSEFGFALAGFDIGYAGIISGGGYRHGLSLRGMITVPLFGIGDSRFVLAPYARYCVVWGGPDALEFGAMIKFAVHLYTGREWQEAAQQGGNP